MTLKKTDLRYVILPGRSLCNDPYYIHLYNLAYNYWFNYWGDFFIKSGHPEAFNVNEFYRQDYLCMILNQSDEVIAFHSATQFNLNLKAAIDHRYLSIFESHLINQLIAKNLTKTLSFELLSVPEKWRKTNLHMSFGCAAVGLFLKKMIESSYDLVFAYARRANTSSRIAYSFGAKCLMENIDRAGHPCDLITFEKETLSLQSDSDYLNDVMNYLWHHRIDFTKSTYTETNKLTA